MDIELQYPAKSTLGVNLWKSGRIGNVTLTRWRNGNPVGTSHTEMSAAQARALAAELIKAATELEA